MNNFILVVNDGVIDGFDNKFSLINAVDFLEALVYAQINENFPKNTDWQDSLFEIGYESMLSDNSISIKSYMGLRQQYVNYCVSLNLSLRSIIEPHLFSGKYTDLKRKDKNTYVFYNSP